MNLGKETILAGVLGFALGLVAAWAVWSLPQFLPKKQAPSSIQVEGSPAPSLAQGFLLTLSQPADGAIAETNKITVAGKTQAGATVVIDGPQADEVVEASADGTFTTTLDLDEGTNEISVTAYAADGSEKTETRTVNYTKETF